MPESGKKKRASKSTRSSAKSRTNGTSADPVIGGQESGGSEGPERSATDELIPSGPEDMTINDLQPEPEPVKVMANGTENGITKLLYDQELIDQVITEMVSNVAMDGLAEEVADKLADSLEENLEFRQRLITGVMKNENSRSKLIRAIIEHLK